MSISRALAALFVGMMFSSSLGAAEKTSPGSVEFFEKKIRPLLAEKCYHCHGEKKVKGGLRLNTRDGMMKGGEIGAAMVPGDPEHSLLIQAVRRIGDLKMPPEEVLKEHEIADLTAWVKAGAPWPDASNFTPVEIGKGPVFTKEQKEFWAFQPVKEPMVPTVKDKNWPRSPLDHFILNKLESKSLKPAGPADKRALIRRVTFDLTGLLPTPEEVDAFLADDSPRAFAKVVDRLLASPAYGERWARHWLDVARYSDSNGLGLNVALTNAWRYRDYVVNAFNKDKPYDEFVMEQLAGDLMPAGPDAEKNYERLTATGFLAFGPRALDDRDLEKVAMDVVDEQIDVTTKAFLGLTVACARCHDHKFDPIPTRDYYGLAGMFKSTKAFDGIFPNHAPLAPKADVDRAEAHKKKIADKDKELKEAKDPKLKARFKLELEDLKKAMPELPMAMAVKDDAVIVNLRVHVRGNYRTLGDWAPRRFPQILAGEKQDPISPKSSGRLELARWLIRPDHPLTARVMVNRIWQHHFGEGLVRSSDNFGRLGERPSHPELLDWLATRFVEKKWSMKEMHRLILLSSTYQMSTTYRAEAALSDPDNRLLWRMNRRRMEVEGIRDGMLQTSGRLDRTRGGSMVTLFVLGLIANDPEGKAAKFDCNRRTIYLPVIRTAAYDVMQVFDFVDPSVPNGKRIVTTVAPQALFLMNSPFAIAQSKYFAEDLLKRENLDDAGRIKLAYLRTFARPPRAEELKSALDYVKKYSRTLEGKTGAERRLAAWQSYCQILFASNEFAYVN